jgi:hypothetical protein
MFDFKKKVLSPLVKSFASKIDEALRKDSVADKMETLLSVKDAVNDSFSKIAKRGAWKGAVGALAILAGLFTAGVSGLLVVGSLSVAALVSSPLVLAEAALYVTGAVLSMSLVARSSQIQTARKPLEAKIDGEVYSLAEKHPREVVKSPRFLKALKDCLNIAAAPKAVAASLPISPAPQLPKLDQPTSPA